MLAVELKGKPIISEATLRWIDSQYFLPYGFSSVCVTSSGVKLSIADLGFMTERIYRQPKCEYDFEATLRVLDRKIAKIVSQNFGKDIHLFFSGGKDSTLLADRLNHLGIKFVAHTFCAKNDEEVERIAVLAEIMGIDLTIHVPNVSPIDLTTHFVRMREPNLDPALGHYLGFLRQMNASGGVFLDGMGNDIYMGHVRPFRDRLKAHLSTFPMLAVLPHPSFKYCVDSVLADFPLLEPNRHSCGELARLYRGATSGYAYQSHSLQRALTRGIHYDVCCAMGKGLLAAEQFQNCIIEFPFWDREFFELYGQFGPDCDGSTNKLGLRKYLESQYGYSEIFPKKNIFAPHPLMHPKNKQIRRMLITAWLEENR